MDRRDKTYGIEVVVTHVIVLQNSSLCDIIFMDC